MGDRDGLGCSVLALAAAVAAVAFLLGRASVGWFGEPPRQPLVVATAVAGAPAVAAAATPGAAGAPLAPVPTATARPIVGPADAPGQASPAAARGEEPAARRSPPAEPTPTRAWTRATRPPDPPPATRTPSPSAPAATPPAATRDPDRCDPAYPTVCLPPPPPNLDCSATDERNFPVRRPDPHGLDSDRDGVGCEPIR